MLFLNPLWNFLLYSAIALHNTFKSRYISCGDAVFNPFSSSSATYFLKLIQVLRSLMYGIQYTPTFLSACGASSLARASKDYFFFFLR